MARAKPWVSESDHSAAHWGTRNTARRRTSLTFKLYVAKLLAPWALAEVIRGGRGSINAQTLWLQIAQGRSYLHTIRPKAAMIYLLGDLGKRSLNL